MTFIVYGLPRSRTFWLSQFLSYREWICGHDEIRHVRSLRDIDDWFAQPSTGTVETAAAPWWRLIHSRVRDLRVVVVRRPVGEVVASLTALGIHGQEANIRRLDAKLSQIEHRVPNVLSVRYDELFDEGGCAKVFQHCLPYPHDHQWWLLLSALNLQAKMHGLFRYYQAHWGQLTTVGDIAKQSMLAALTARPRKSLDGLVVDQEPFDTFLADGKRLFERHLAEVGEPSQNWAEKNIPLMKSLEGIGRLQVTTARANGRMFGYLVSVIGPSLEDADRLEGVHTIFFASPDYPGLGMRLQRSSLDGLRRRGVGRAYFRAGTRGDGPRMGALYRRLGATDYGQYFSLDLKAV